MLAKTQTLSLSRSTRTSKTSSILQKNDSLEDAWIIYHLTRDMLTYYWYRVQCKVFGFVRNQKHEGNICSTTIRASAISNTNTLICMDVDKPYIRLMNNNL